MDCNFPLAAIVYYNGCRMNTPALMKLAQDLEWLGCELEHCGHQHALEGFPEAGPNWEAFREKQRGVLTTADKVERELKNSVRYNPAHLVGVDYAIEDTLDSIAGLLGAVEDIKQSAVFSVQELPPKVRGFTHLIDSYLKSASTVSR
jgi:hypothetical protein